MSGEMPFPELILTPLEARVLGCLVEKKETTPDVYPLTVNATHAAVNQKTARDPIMAAEVLEVHRTLAQLVRKGYARQAFASRAERFEHMLPQRLKTDARQTVLLALLMLRGPQTAHELLARSERMAKFGSVDDVRTALSEMIDGDIPLVVQLERASGQREERYAHLLCGPVSVGDTAPVPIRSSGDESLIDALQKRVQVLEDKVESLISKLAELGG